MKPDEVNERADIVSMCFNNMCSYQYCRYRKPTNESVLIRLLLIGWARMLQGHTGP